jgi:hypothetical protein
MLFAIFSLSYQVYSRNHVPFFQLYHPPELGYQTIDHTLKHQICISSPCFYYHLVSRTNKISAGRVYPLGSANLCVTVIGRLLIHKIHNMFLFISPRFVELATRSMVPSTILMNHNTLKNLVQIGEIITFHFFLLGEKINLKRQGLQDLSLL